MAEDKDTVRGIVVARAITQGTQKPQTTARHHEVAEDMDAVKGVVGEGNI